MFEKASKLKLRFDTNRGKVSVEDLWDLPLTSTRITSLDTLYKQLRKAADDLEEVSLVTTSTKVTTVTNLKLDIVKHITLAKMEQVEKNKKSVETKAKNQKILRVISDLEDKELEGTSIEDLRKMLVAEE